MTEIRRCLAICGSSTGLMRFLSVLILLLHRMHPSQNEKSLCPVTLRVRQVHRALIMWCQHLESLDFWVRETPFSFFPTSHNDATMLCEMLDNSQMLQGNKFGFPAIPWSCTAKNVQLARSRFAFCCSVM